MNESSHSEHGKQALKHGRVQPGSRPAYWKRAHRNPWFWVGLVLMLTAMTIYIVSDDLAFLPHSQPRQPMPVAVGG